jgi:hypothetical protein
VGWLEGTLNYALERVAILVLKKHTDDEFHLIAPSGDGQRIRNEPDSASSFYLPEKFPDEPTC